MNNQREQVSIERAFSMALQSHRDGKYARAERVYRQVIAQAPAGYPRLHVLHSNLGVAVASQGRPDEALPFFHRAIELCPDYAEAYANLGLALKSDGRFAQALQAFETAVNLQGDDPNTLVNLGILHAELGELEAAVTCLRDALRSDPTRADAWLRLVTLQDGAISDNDCATIRQLLLRDDLSAEQQACLNAALARVHDRREEYDRAAGHADHANACQLSHLQRSAKEYSPDAHAQFVDRVIATFDTALLERSCGPGSDSSAPVFVFGMPRSGTTLVEQILASHPQVCGAGELGYIFDSFHSLPRVTGFRQPPMKCVRMLNRDHIQKVAAQHLDRLRKLDAGAKHVTNKLPDNYLLVGFIRMLFPNSPLIHCRRDVRDVAVSCWITNFHSVRWSHDHAHIASRINAYQRVMNHWSDLLAGQILHVNYEQLVRNPETVSRELVAWCGLEWDPACLGYHRNRRAVKTASETQVRQAITTKSVGRFRNYQSHLADLFAAIYEPQDS